MELGGSRLGGYHNNKQRTAEKEHVLLTVSSAVRDLVGVVFQSSSPLWFFFLCVSVFYQRASSHLRYTYTRSTAPRPPPEAIVLINKLLSTAPRKSRCHRVFITQHLSSLALNHGRPDRLQRHTGADDGLWG